MAQPAVRIPASSVWSSEVSTAGLATWGQPAQPDPVKITFGLRQKEPTAACADILAKMSAPSTTPALVSAYAEALRSLPPHSGERAAELQKALVPALLNSILVRLPDETSATDSASAQRLARLNAGALLGELFLHKYLQGDGLLVAQRLISSSEVTLSSQFAAACNLAEPCSVDVAAPSACLFWTTVANTAASHPDSAVRTTLAERLTRYLHFIIAAAARGTKRKPRKGSDGEKHRGGHEWTSESEGSDESQPANGVSPVKLSAPLASDHPMPTTDFHVTAPAKPSDAPVVPAAIKERPEVPAVRRTVFVSDIQDEMTPAALKAALDEFGTPLKVRIVQGSKSFMGYCEMSTETAAKRMTSLGRAVVNGAFIRFQSVKNPITGSDATDAVLDSEGSNIIAPCTFGRSTVPFCANTKVRTAPRPKH